MDPDFSKSPFGRSLRLLAHRLPRKSKEGQDWELERGFHLSVLGEETFSLTLAGRQSGEKLTLSLCTDTRDAELENFVIWHCPGKYRPERFEEFAELVREQDSIGLILSQTSEHTRATLDYPKYRGVWREVTTPVIQVFQDIPDARYFTVEKCLFSLGRIGRRVRKLGRIRRLMPW